MRKGCAYGLGCLVVFILSPLWVPLLFSAVVFALSLVSVLLERI
jgi:hypothetical protein